MNEGFKPYGSDAALKGFSNKKNCLLVVLLSSCGQDRKMYCWLDPPKS